MYGIKYIAVIGTLMISVSARGADEDNLNERVASATTSPVFVGVDFTPAPQLRLAMKNHIYMLSTLVGVCLLCRSAAAAPIFFDEMIPASACQLEFPSDAGKADLVDGRG